jgi:hypothetical protein
MNSQDVNISPDQIHGAARAGVNLLNRDSTLVPGSLRQQLAVLELILGNILNGRFMVVSSMPVEVELPSKAGETAGEGTDADTGAKTNGRASRKPK